MPIRDEHTLTVMDVARILGITSPATIANWLENGSFPGAVRTRDGQRRFRMSDIKAVQARIAATRVENEAGIIDIPDFGDEDPRARRRSASTGV